jgi:hypothetical protein
MDCVFITSHSNKIWICNAKDKYHELRCYFNSSCLMLTILFCSWKLPLSRTVMHPVHKADIYKFLLMVLLSIIGNGLH